VSDLPPTPDERPRPSRFDARPVVRRGISLRTLIWSAVGASAATVVVILAMQVYLRERIGGKMEAEELARRMFYEMVPGASLTVPAADVYDRLIASIVVRNRSPKTDVHILIEWFDGEGNQLASRGWRRPVSERITTVGSESLERYLIPGGDELAGPRQITLRDEDFPAGTTKLTFTLLQPTDIPIFVRFYTRTALQPGATHLEAILLDRREKRLEARTALPSALAPPELIDRLTGWKWITVAATGERLKPTHLFRRDVPTAGSGAGEDGAPEDRLAGDESAKGRPLAYAITAQGRYELAVLEGEEGELEVETRVPGRLPELTRVAVRGTGPVWSEVLEVPSAVIVRRLSGEAAEVRLALHPPGGGEDLISPPLSSPSMTWLTGPADAVLPVRAAIATTAIAVALPDSLRFDMSVGASDRGATLRFRVRAVHPAGEAPPAAVAVVCRVSGGGRLALAEERVEVPLAPADLERLPRAWTEPTAEGDPTWRVTGPGDFYLEVPEETRRVEIRTESPAIVVPLHTMPLLRSTAVIPAETPDRTLCWLQSDAPDDSRAWHYLRPSNEPELRATGCACVLDLPVPEVQPPLRGAVSADTLWDREASMPRVHAGSALALWPGRPLGAISPTRMFPWGGPWPSSAYRPVAPGEAPEPVFSDPGLPDPMDVLVAGADGLLTRVHWLTGPLPPGAAWLNRPVAGDPDPDPRHARLLRRAWHATPDLAAEFEVAHDGAETWVSLNAQFEPAAGEPAPPAALDIDVDAPPWAKRRRAWAGSRTDARRRVYAPPADGERAIFLDAAAPLAGAVSQTRLRLGSDLPSGDYIVRVRPLSGGVWLSAGVSRLGGRAVLNGTAWTFNTEGLGGRRFGIASPGRDPSRDLVIEAIVPGRAPSRLAAEPLLDRWSVAVPADSIALRVRCIGAGPGPVALTIERPGAPKPMPLSVLESRDSWRVLLPAIHDTWRPSSLGEERARVRLLWEAPSPESVPPERGIDVSVGGPEGRREFRFSPRWLREPRTFDAERPQAILWSSDWMEVTVPAGGTDAAVRVMAEGYWVRWERLAGPPSHVALHTRGSLEFFPHASFLVRTRRGTGLWDGEPRPDYDWPARDTWSTPWEYSEGASEEWPEPPLVPSDVVVVGATDQFELARPAAWRDPDRRPGPLWRPLPLGSPIEAVVGDALGRARFASLRLSFQDVSIEGDAAASVDVLVDGVPRLAETLFRPRGELSVTGLTAGKHTVLVRPAAGVAAYRCGLWRVRTVDLPLEGDWIISAVWQAPQDGSVEFEVGEVKAGEQVVLEVLSKAPPGAAWDLWQFSWIEPDPASPGAWIPTVAENHWVAPGAGADGTRTGADGAPWLPGLRMAWDLTPLGGKRIRGWLQGPLRRGDAVHVFRMTTESGPLSDVDEVRKR
jgi:hypothetical protein